MSLFLHNYFVETRPLIVHVRNHYVSCRSFSLSRGLILFLGKALACYQQLTYLYVATNMTFMSRELEQEESISTEDQRVIGLEAADYIWRLAKHSFHILCFSESSRPLCEVSHRTPLG